MLYINGDGKLCLYDRIISERVDDYTCIGPNQYLYLYNNHINYFEIIKKDGELRHSRVYIELDGVAPIRKFYAQMSEDFVRILYKCGDKWIVSAYFFETSTLRIVPDNIMANVVTKVSHGFMIDGKWFCDYGYYKISNPDEYIFTDESAYHIKDKPIMLEGIIVQPSETRAFLGNYILVYKDELYRLSFDEYEESPRYEFIDVLRNGICQQTRCGAMLFNIPKGLLYVNIYESKLCVNVKFHIIKEFCLF